jgi:ParB/RepB/Spo0J family partition protein
MEVFEIEFDEITVDYPGFVNSRTDLDESQVKSLMTSILKDGLMQPPILWQAPDPDDEEGTVYVLVAGRRRYEAISLIRKTHGEDNFEKLNVAIFEGTLEDAMVVNLRENLDRKDLGTYDEIVYCYKLYDRVGDQYKVAQRLNKSQAWVSTRCRIMEQGIPELHEAVKQDKIGYKKAYRISGLVNKDKTPNVSEQTEAIEIELGIRDRPKRDVKKTHIIAKDVVEFETKLNEAEASDVVVDPDHVKSLRAAIKFMRAQCSAEDLIFLTEAATKEEEPAEEAVAAEEAPKKKRRRKKAATTEEASA